MCCEQCPTVSKIGRKWTQEAKCELPPSSRSGGPWGGSPTPGGHPCKLLRMPTLLTQRCSEHDAIQYTERVGIKLLLQVCRGAPVLTLKLKYMIQYLGAFISTNLYSDFSQSVCAKSYKSSLYYSAFIGFSCPLVQNHRCIYHQTLR
jgi:hypothetical protein